MDWWDSVVDFGSDVADWFGNNSDIVAPALMAGATVASSVIGANANNDAAAAAAEAERARTQAIVDGNAAAQKRYEEVQSQTAGGRSRLQGIVAAPTALTPLQKQQLEDTRRTTANSLQRSGFAGSPRATVAAFRAVEGDAKNKMIATNEGRADAAATTLANMGNAATTRAASLDSATGQAIGAGAANAGYNDANTSIANANLTGRALSDITSIIATEKKARDSRWTPPNTRYVTGPGSTMTGPSGGV